MPKKSEQRILSLINRAKTLKRGVPAAIMTGAPTTAKPHKPRKPEKPAPVAIRDYANTVGAQKQVRRSLLLNPGVKATPAVHPSMKPSKNHNS